MITDSIKLTDEDIKQLKKKGFIKAVGIKDKDTIEVIYLTEEDVLNQENAEITERRAGLKEMQERLMIELRKVQTK